MIKPKERLELSIRALEIFDIEPNIIKSMLIDLNRITGDNQVAVYDCRKCKHSFANPFDQYFCTYADDKKEYDVDTDDDCNGIHFEQ